MEARGWSATGKGPQTKEYRWPLEAETGRETESALKRQAERKYRKMRKHEKC